MLATIRSGDWLTAERLRVYPLILLAIFSAAALWAIVTSHDRMGPNHLPLGSDFSQVWVAGHEVLSGNPDAPFDIARHAAAQRKEFGPETGIFGWHYPPYFLALAALFATLPYLPALALWQVGTLAFYLLPIVAILGKSGVPRRRALIAALAFPAVIVNLGHGQNGFLTAALLGGGFFLLERRPLAAGALFAFLAYKPQFALALPLALLIGSHWRALGSAAATLAFMTAMSLAAFGATSWRAFFESLGFTRKVVEEGGPGFEKIQSIFAAVRLLGGDVPTAYFWQGSATFCAFAGLIWVLRSQADARVKAAATIETTLLSTPYLLDYDLMALAPALALLVSRGIDKGFRPYEKTAFALAYVAPLVARPAAAALGLPIGVAALALLFCVTIRASQAAQNVEGVTETEAENLVPAANQQSSLPLINHARTGC